MEKHIKMERILVYYDVPQVFIGIDNIETRYICMLYDDATGSEYVAVSASMKRVTQLVGGKIELRAVFTNPEIENEYYFVKNQNNVLILTQSNLPVLPENMLPDNGFVLEEEQADDTILAESLSWNKPIIHLGLSDANNTHSIEADTFAGIINSYQSFISNCHRKLAGKKDEECTLRLFSSSAASFNIHMYVDTQLNLFGESRLDATMKFIDEVFSIQEEDKLLAKLKAIQGHAITSYKTLLKELIDNKLTVKYKWLSPSNERYVSSHKVPLYQLENVYSCLIQSTELGIEKKNFYGYFEKVDIGNGDWRFHNEEDNKAYSGKSSNDMLAGITVETSRYNIECEEHLERRNISEKIKAVYFLISKEAKGI